VAIAVGLRGRESVDTHAFEGLAESFADDPLKDGRDY